MSTLHLKSLGCLLVVTNVALADASYQETTQVTGGDFVNSIKSMPFVPKQMKSMFDPVNSLKLLQGNRLASVSKSATEIIDLDQETITRIDSDKKTYTVTTFAQIRQGIRDAPKKLAQVQGAMKQQQANPVANANPPTAAGPSDSGNPAPQIQVTYEVSVTDTGVSKVVNGVMAKEQLVALKAHLTDPTPQADGSQATMTYSCITDLWTAPEPPEMKEIDDFFLRYAKKMLQGVDAAALMKSLQPEISGSATMSLFASNPGMGAALQEARKKMTTEMQKIKGTKILEVTRFGGDAMSVTPGATAVSPPPRPNPAGTVAAQVATNTATDAAASEAGKLGTLGSAFGHSLIGAFHKTASPPPATPAPASGSAPTSSSAMLYETTTQKSDFSQEAIPPEAFQIPAGYTKVDLNDPTQASN